MEQNLTGGTIDLDAAIDLDEIFIDPLKIVDSSSESVSETSLLGSDIERPYFVVRNISYAKEKEYFLSGDEYGLPVYFLANGIFKPIGSMEPSLKQVLKARFLDTNITYMDASGEELSLDDPLVLVKFITIPLDMITA